MTRGTRRSALVMAAVALGLAACTSSAPDRAGGHGLQEPTVLEIAQLDDVAPAQVRAFADEVDRQSHGTIRLDFKDEWRSGEVDFERHTLDDVITGNIKGAWVGVRALDSVGVTSFQPLVAPLLVDSHALEERVFSDGIPFEMARGLEGHGLVAIAVLPGPMRKVLGVRQPFRVPADFRGATLGIQGGAVSEATAKALGATFTRMPSGANLTQVDAYEQHVGNIVGSFYGLDAKYVTANVDLWPQAMVVVLNDATYRSLSDAQREVLRAAASSTIPAALDATRSEDDAGGATLCRQGVTFPSASDAQLAALRRAVQPVYDEIGKASGNASMLERLTRLKADVNAPPELFACHGQGQEDSRGSFPQGTYDMALDPDAGAQCPGSSSQGGLGQKSSYVLEVRDNRFTIRKRIDSQTVSWGVRYDGTYSTLLDRIKVDNFSASWSYDGSSLRLSDLTGGSCEDAIIWTTNPWVRRASPTTGSGAVPDGTYESSLTDADRSLCDSRSDAHDTGLQSDAGGKPTLFATLTLDAGAFKGQRREDNPSAIPILEWVGSYRVTGSTFELATLTQVDPGAAPRRRGPLTATFTFDGTALTLTPVGTPWPCWVRVEWTRHPWTLTKRAP